jgi:hypothetical protein
VGIVGASVRQTPLTKFENGEGRLSLSPIRPAQDVIGVGPGGIRKREERQDAYLKQWQ